MALRKVNLRVLFGAGVDTKTVDKAVSMPRMLALENALFTRPGAIGKRHGHDALSADVLGSMDGYTGARALAVRGAELVLFTGNRAYSYVDGAAKWSDVGPVLSVSQSDRAIAKAPAIQTLGDYAAEDGIAVAAWEDSRGGVYWCVVEDDGGRILRAVSQASATGTRPRCVRTDGKLVVLWAEAALGQIKIIIIDPTEPHTYNAGLYPSVLVSDLVTTAPHYDAEYVPPSVFTDIDEVAAIAWNSVTGIQLGFIHPTGVIGSPGTGMPSPITIATGVTPVTCLSLAVAPWLSTLMGLAWGAAGGSRAAMYERIAGAISVVTAPTDLSVANVDAIACAWRYVANTPDYALDVYLEDRASPNRNSTVAVKSLSLAGAVTGSTVWRGCCLASKAFTDSHDDSAATSGSFVTVVHDVPIFGVYMTMRHDGICVARSLPGVAGDAPSRAHLPSVIDDVDRVHRWVAGAKAQLDGVNGDVFTEQGLRLVTLDFDDANSHQTAQIGTSLYLGGACPQVYDGQGWVEHNFHYGIDWETSETLHVQGTAGALTALGTYSWIFVPEYTLANGEIVLGPPSKPYEVTLTGANDDVTFTVPTVRITRMTNQTGLGGQSRAEVRIGVYRSLNGDASVYYRCSSLDPSAVGANGYLANDPTADTVSFQDAMSDATLATKEPLYTNGDILENDPIAGSGILVVGKGRLFSTHPSDGNLVTFSQERDDRRAIDWPDGLRIRVDDVGGAITALGVLDDALVIFKRSAIYYVAGPGPNASLSDGGFSAPVQLTGEVGCTVAKSIVAMRDGLMFKSSKGIYLLDRSRQVGYLGAPVEAYNSQAVTRATLVDDTTQVRFLTDDGAALLYDYQAQQWSTLSQHEGKDAAVVGGVYHYLRADGRVLVEDTTGYDDDGNRIPLVLETAWIHFQEHLQGLQRVWFLYVLGTWKSAHRLRVQYRLDYGTSWSEPAEFDNTDESGSVYGEGAYGAGVYGGTEPTLYQFKVHVGRRCQAIQVRITDYEDAGDAGASAEFTELLIVGGIKGPEPRMPAARSG